QVRDHGQGAGGPPDASGDARRRGLGARVDLTGVARAQGPGVAAGFEIDGNLMSDAAGQRDWFTGSAGAGVLLGSPNCGQQNPLYAPAFFRRDGVSLADTTIGSGKNNSDLSPGSPQAWTIHTGSSVSDK